MLLDVCWWLGALYCAAWVALPLALIPVAGAPAALLLWPVLAPWSALAGLSAAHRLLPRSAPGTYRVGRDAGALCWAAKQWAPSLFLTVFQPVFGQSERFLRLALRAFGARLGPRAHVTSRTILREPHHVRLGADTLIGEYAHLIASYQPRTGILVVAPLSIGDGTMVGGYTQIGPGTRIGSACVIGHDVRIAAQVTIGNRTRIGAGTSIYNLARIGSGARIGKGCFIPAGAVIEDGARIPDGTILRHPHLLATAGAA